MHKELEQFFETHRSKAEETKTNLHGMIDTAMDVIHVAQEHIRDTRVQLRKAMLAPHDHAIDGNLNFLKTRLKSLDDSVDALLAAAEDVAARAVEIENAFAPATVRIAFMLNDQTTDIPPDESSVPVEKEDK